MVNHTNVMGIADTFEMNYHTFLVMEHAETDLWRYSMSMSAKLIRPIFNQLLDAVDYIHSLNISHCDIKPENVLIKNTANPHVKLSDFGLSTFVEYSNGIRRGSLSFMSPENYNFEADISWKKNDIWALGVTLFNLLTESLPWGTPTTDFSILKKHQSKYHFSNEFMVILRQIFGPPENRPTAMELKAQIQGLESFYSDRII